MTRRKRSFGAAETVSETDLLAADPVDLLNDGHYFRAALLLEQELGGPDNEWATHVLSCVYGRAKLFDESLKLSSDVIRGNGDYSYYAAANHAEMLMYVRRYEEAFHLFDRLCDGTDDSLWVCAVGSMRFDLHGFAEPARYFAQKAVRLKAREVQDQVRLADAYVLLENVPMAVRHARAAYRLKPDSAAASLVASLYLSVGNYPRAGQWILLGRSFLCQTRRPLGEYEIMRDEVAVLRSLWPRLESHLSRSRIA